MKKNIFFILTLLLVLSSTTANDSNVLLTGGALPKDGQLSYKDTSFVMQDDCNLVLYNQASGFQSNTHQDGSPNCRLTLNNEGQLVITDSHNNVIYNSPSNSTKKGKYAAVLRPDGQVAVYGPLIWSTPALSSSNNDLNEAKSTGNTPKVQNLMFSSQILYNGEALVSRDYRLVMDADCVLKLFKAGTGVVFESKTAGKGKNCFLRLDHTGVLSVLDDKYKSLWSGGKVGGYGAYVLIMQINGQAAVYGPVVWDTAI